MFYSEAIRDGMRQAMRADERVYLLGEDVGVMGGIYGVTKGLLEEFGPKRIKNTPLSEIGIIGEAMGASMMGLKPIAEMQFSDFMTTAFSTIVDVAAPYRFRTGTKTPFVIRAPIGGGLHIGPYHSKSPEAWFFHVPGIKIVMPATPRDAKGLLQSALEDDELVLYFEHKKLYYDLKEDVPEGIFRESLGKACVRREGSDVTIITYSAMVHQALKAAQELESEKISVEVLDLRTLVPLDTETMLNSVSKTHRVVFLHEAPIRGGVGAELESIVCETIFHELKAPPKRVAAKMTPVPVAPNLEDFYLPSLQDIKNAVHSLLL